MLPEAELRARWKELRDERDQLESERQRLIVSRQASVEAAAELAEVQAWFAELRGAVRDMSYAMKRRALAALEVKATVYPAGSEQRWLITAAVPLFPRDAITSTPF